MAEPEPNPEPPTPSNPPAPKQQPEASKQESFSREYVHELREENKGWRLKAQEMQQAAERAKEQAEKAQREADEKATQAETKAQERIIRAELKAEALKAGMIDLDGLKLADLSSISLSDDGEVQGAAELMETLKESKPYLFGEPGKSSSSTKEVPPKEPPKAKKATEMSTEEYAAAKAQLTGKSRSRAY